MCGKFARKERIVREFWQQEELVVKLINDADYVIAKRMANGKLERCPFHSRWHNVTNRVINKYDRSYDESQIVKEWLRFSTFKSWMEVQDWQGNELDKDIIVKGNQLYGPDTCSFVPRRLNTLLNTQRFTSKNSLLGTSYSQPSSDMVNPLKKPWRAQVSSFDDGRQIYLGCHSTQEEAHKVWQIAKAKEISKAIDWYISKDIYDNRIVQGLKSRKDELESAAKLGIPIYRL